MLAAGNLPSRRSVDTFLGLGAGLMFAQASMWHQLPINSFLMHAKGSASNTDGTHHILLLVEVMFAALEFSYVLMELVNG